LGSIEETPPRKRRRGRHSNWRLLMSYLKAKLSLPVVKYSVLAVAFTLWGLGLVDQFYSSAAVMKYILLSLLIAAVALF
jgi:hypothetical protein